MRRNPKIVLAAPAREIADVCLEMGRAAVREMGSRGETVNGFVAALVVIERWLDGSLRDEELRAGVAEAKEMRDVLQRSISTHEAGMERIDASIRTTIAWMIWRLGSFVLGRQDATVLVWCRMGLAEVRARYEGIPESVTTLLTQPAEEEPAPAYEQAGGLPGLPERTPWKGPSE